jgi:uncharacterized protein (TIGR00251 family)
MIKEDKFKIIVKTNAKKNELLGYNISEKQNFSEYTQKSKISDEEKKAYKLNIKEPAKDNKANKEIIKFLTKLLGKKVKIKSGLTSKEKIIHL